MRFFEDYRVGETFKTDTRRITAREVDAFVEYIGVRNPLFLDAKHASRGPFGTRIVPGFLTQSLSLGLLYQPKIIQYFLLTKAETRFLKPLRVGDTIHVEGRVTRKKTTPQKKAGLLTLRTEILIQAQRKVAEMTLTVSILKGGQRSPNSKPQPEGGRGLIDANPPTRYPEGPPRRTAANSTSSPATGRRRSTSNSSRSTTSTSGRTGIRSRSTIRALTNVD